MKSLAYPPSGGFTVARQLRTFTGFLHLHKKSTSNIITYSILLPIIDYYKQLFSKKNEFCYEYFKKPWNANQDSNKLIDIVSNKSLL